VAQYKDLTSRQIQKVKELRSASNSKANEASAIKTVVTFLCAIFHKGFKVKKEVARCQKIVKIFLFKLSKFYFQTGQNFLLRTVKKFLFQKDQNFSLQFIKIFFSSDQIVHSQIIAI
jgi:hypothetical protein